MSETQPDDEGISPYWRTRAAEFHDRHPDIYNRLVFYAREARAAGRSRIGIELLWNRMRWDWAIRTGEPDFKVNQNYKAWYARRIMEQERDLTGIFEIRRRT